MVLRRFENGVEVERLHPQALQIVQLLQHALEVPAEKVPVAHLPLVVGAVLGELLPALVDGAPPHQALRVGGLAAAEAVGENLVGDPLAKPAGGLLRPVIDGELVGAQLLAAAVQLLQPEGVPHQPHIAGGVQLHGEQILPQIVALPGHFQDKHLVEPALKADVDAGVGKALRSGRAQGKLYLRPGGHRPIGGLVPAVPGVVGGQIWHWYHSERWNICRGTLSVSPLGCQLPQRGSFFTSPFGRGGTAKPWRRGPLL